MPTHTHPPPPLGEPESKQKGFVAPILIFPSANISKTINMLCKHGTTNVIIRKKWNGTNIEQNGTFKIPHFRTMVLMHAFEFRTKILGAL